jgi:hypothetical protein
MCIEKKGDVVVFSVRKTKLLDETTFLTLITEAAVDGKLLINGEASHKRLISSSMIGHMMRLIGPIIKECKRKRIWLKLCGMPPRITEVFRLMNLHIWLGGEIHVDEEEALEAFRGHNPDSS